MSNELISRQNAIEACTEYVNRDTTTTEEAIGAEYCIDLLKALPTAESELREWVITCPECNTRLPVVLEVFYEKTERNKGEWIYDCERINNDGWIQKQYHCSKCGYQLIGSLGNFCPNCGADNRS